MIRTVISTLFLLFSTFIASWGQIIAGSTLIADYTFSGTADATNSFGSSGVVISGGTFKIYDAPGAAVSGSVNNQIEIKFTNSSSFHAPPTAADNHIKEFGFVDPYNTPTLWAEDAIFGKDVSSNNDWGLVTDGGTLFNVNSGGGANDNGPARMFIGESGTFVIDYKGVDALAGLISQINTNVPTSPPADTNGLKTWDLAFHAGTTINPIGGGDSDKFGLELQAVPEPSTYALIFGSIALGVVVFKRRLSNKEQSS